MESLELRIFIEVAHSASISKAADKMGYVQSNITSHIKKLETELATQLFVRHNKGVSLTKDGERLLYAAEKIITMLDETAHRFNNKEHTFRIGTTQTIANAILPKCIIKFHKHFPNTPISIQTYSHDSLMNNNSQEKIDCILTNRLQILDNYPLIFELPESLRIITPSTCQSLDDIEQLPVIVNSNEHCPYRELLLKWYYNQCTTPPKIIEFDTIDAILNMVKTGGGISLLPITVLNQSTEINRFNVNNKNSYIRMYQVNNKFSEEIHFFKQIITEQIHLSTFAKAT